MFPHGAKPAVTAWAKNRVRVAVQHHAANADARARGNASLAMAAPVGPPVSALTWRTVVGELLTTPAPSCFSQSDAARDRAFA